MSRRSKGEVLRMMQERYAGRGREGRRRLLDEFCELCGYERKYAIKLLGRKRRGGGKAKGKSGSKPKYRETDTVAHCGESMAGDFCWSVTMTDVHTQWTEAQAVWNKGQYAVQQRIGEVEQALPFAILGFDSDNGGEFINWHLADYFALRPQAVAFTRSRAYRKNDNARVEQKNWTHVRQLVGYVRLEDPAQAEQLNALYVEEWNLFRNFFCPVMKHVRTEVEGSRKKRVYDRPATPFERLQASAGVAPEQIERLEKLKTTLQPFAMKRRIEKKLRRLFKAPARTRFPVAA